MKREERMKSRSGSEENGNNSDKSDQANLVSVEPTITKVKDIAEEEPMSVSGSSSSEDEEIVEVSDLKEKNNDIEMQVEVEQNNNSLEEGQEMMGRNNADKEGGKIKIPVTGQVYINPAEFFMETQQLELKLGIPVDSQKAGEFYGASYAAFLKKMMQEGGATISAQVLQQSIFRPSTAASSSSLDHEADNRAAKIMVIQQQRKLNEQKRLEEQQKPNVPLDDLGQLQSKRKTG